MLIERNYYDITMDQQKEWEEQIKEKRKKLTETELFIQKQKYASEVEEIIRSGKNLQSKQVLDIQLKNLFLLLQKTSLEVAEICDMNFKSEINEETMFGYIEFSYGNLWIVPATPKMCSRTIAALYKSACQVSINIVNDRVVQRFEFALHK